MSMNKFIRLIFTTGPYFVSVKFNSFHDSFYKKEKDTLYFKFPFILVCFIFGLHAIANVSVYWANGCLSSIVNFNIGISLRLF